MASSSLLQHYPLNCKWGLNDRFSAVTQRSGSRAGTRFLVHRPDSWSFHGASIWQPRGPIPVQVRAEEGPSGSRDGEKLWRSELLTQDSWSEDSLLQRDEEAAKQVQQAQSQKISRNREDADRGSVMSLVGGLIEKLLVADFFFILFILFWFLAGLAEKAAFDTSALIDAWFPLWSPVFQPALGFFMAAAIWTALKNWLKR